MSLQDFPRYPLLFGPSPVHPLRAADRAPRRRRDLGQARGLQQRAGLRRQQDPQARVPRPGRARRRAPTPWCRSAAYQSNHTRQVAAVAAKLGLKARAGAGELGRLAGLRSTTGSATSCCRGSWAPTSGSTRPASASASSDSWEQALDDVRARGGTPYAIPAGASDHRLGGLGFANWAYEVAAAGAASSASSSTRSSSAPSPGRTHAGMIAGLRRPGPAAPGARHRRLGASSTRPATRWRSIARNTAELIGLGRDLRDDEITVLEGWAGDYYGIPVAVDARRDPADRPARGHDHRPGLRGQVDGRADRPGHAAARSPRTPPCCTPTSAASPRSTPTARSSRPEVTC